MESFSSYLQRRYPNTPPTLLQSTPTPADTATTTVSGHGGKLRLLGEVTMGMDTDGHYCTGRADYCLGYCGDGNRLLDQMFVVIEAKRLEVVTMDKAIMQALFYIGKRFFGLPQPTR